METLVSNSNPFNDYFQLKWKLSFTDVYYWKSCAVSERLKKNISLNKTFRILILCDFDSAEYSPHIAMDNGFQKYSHSENVVSDDIK